MRVSFVFIVAGFGQCFGVGLCFDLMSLKVFACVLRPGTAYLEFGCLSSSPQGSTFLKESILYGLLPVFLIVMVLLGSLLNSYFRPTDEGPGPWERAKSASLGVGILILFLLQPTLVKRTALVFSCVTMGKNAGDVFMTEDLSIRCWYTSLLF